MHCFVFFVYDNEGEKRIFDMKNIFDFDYNNGIVSLSNSILKYYNVPTKHPSLDVLDKILEKKYQNVIFMILDGMGFKILEKNLPENSFLRTHIISKIYSVFPSTTAAATICFHSGLTPLESGWIGWMSYYPQFNEIIENFNNVSFYTREVLNTPPPAETLIKYKTIYEQILEQNPDVEYEKIFPAFEKNGCETFDEMCERIGQTVNKNNHRKIISAYWTEPDHTTHHCGAGSDEVKEVLKHLDDCLQKLMGQLKDTVLIISADHGLLDVEEIYLNDYPLICDMLRMPPCLEARFVTFYVKNNRKEDFKKEFEKTFGADFKLYTKEEFLKTGLLGDGEQHPCIETSIGDFVSIAVSNKSLRYFSCEEMKKSLKADHAGLSEDEMIVPLIVKTF